MGEKLKARGADDAADLVDVRDCCPNYTKHTKNQFRSQFYTHYDVGADQIATPRRGRKDVARG